MLPRGYAKDEQYGDKRGAKPVEDYCIIQQIFPFIKKAKKRKIAEKEDSRNGLVFDPPVGRLGKVSELPLLSAFEQVVFTRDGGNREARLKTVTGGILRETIRCGKGKQKREPITVPL